MDLIIMQITSVVHEVNFRSTPLTQSYYGIDGLVGSNERLS